MSWSKLAVTGLVIVGLLIIYMTYQIWAAAFLGVLFAMSLNGPAEWVRQYVRRPPWLATALVMLVVLAILAGLGWIIGSPLASQIDDLSKKLPAATQNVITWLEKRPWGQHLLQRAENASGMSPQEMLQENEAPSRPRPAAQGSSAPPDEQPQADGETQRQSGQQDGQQDKAPAGGSQFPSVGRILQSVGGALALATKNGALLAVTLMVMLFVALDPGVYQRGVLWLVPRQHEAMARETMDRLCATLRWWMIGRLVSMTAIGVFTSLGLWMIGMPAPIALGALSGLLSFVPNIGPILGASPGLLLALTQGPWMVLAAVCVYIVAELVESNAVTPLVDQYAVSIPPGMLIVTQFIFAMLTGVWGTLVATPLLVVAIVLVQQLYVRERLKKPIEIIGST